MSKLVAGNWKMFGDQNMLSEIKVIDQYCHKIDCEVALCTPFQLILSAHHPIMAPRWILPGPVQRVQTALWRHYEWPAKWPPRQWRFRNE